MAAIAALQRVSSCEEAAAHVRSLAIARMHARVDQLEGYALQRRAGDYCEEFDGYPVDAGAAEPSSADLDSVLDGAEEGASASSTTNNQVTGVDEADFVKNDSRYVYAVLNGALRIVDAWPAEQAHEVSRTALEGVPKKLFVVQDRALVYVSLPREAASSAGDARSLSQPSYASSSECTYGYDCQFGGDGTATALLVFDVSDRAAPKQIRRLDLSGSLLAARRIGNAVHTVVVTPEVVFPDLSFDEPSSWSCGSMPSAPQIRRHYDQLRARNEVIIETTPLDELVPSVREDGHNYADDSCATVYRETQPSGSAFTTLVSLDMVDDGKPALATVISKPGAVYASAEALYMAVIHEDAKPVSARSSGSSPTAQTPDLASVVHKFRIGTDPTRSAYQASGTVKGHVLNQFSMDEHAGHLRVATSWGRVPSPDVHSTLSVLAQRAQRLEVVGEVDDIAPGEDIRSVRFEGDRGFVVTFKKTDPLYAFDLADPKAPRITGELKIPGFSTYMHMLDADHLLTIGYDAADQGNFAFFTGVLLQIFDVRDPQNPQLAHKTVIGTRGSSSEALTNHLAFTLFQGKLALPMTICEGGGTNGTYGTQMTFSGLIVYDVSVQDGFLERGRVAHPAASGNYESAGCSNWWTRASSVVQRSIIMDEFVYSIAPNVMHIQDLNALGSDVASVAFAP